MFATFPLLFQILITTDGVCDDTFSGNVSIVIGTIPLRLATPPTATNTVSAEVPTQAKQFKGETSILCTLTHLQVSGTPVYALSIFGSGSSHGNSESSGFTPRYIYYQDAE